MKRTSTTTLIAVITLLACFSMLILVLLGLAKSNVSTTTQIVQLITQLIPIVLLFYFGASHINSKNSPQNPKQTQMKQVFWDLTDIGEAIIAIDNETIDAIAAQDIPNIDSRFEVLLDDTNAQVLVVTTTSTVSVTKGDNTTLFSSISDFASGRPVRPK